MEINKFIKEAYQNAIEKGFYECSVCKGIIDFNSENCDNCNGTGIDKNKSIKELLMLVIGEVIETIEAYKNNEFAKSYFNENIYYYLEKYIANPIKLKDVFEKTIKNTFECEIADIFLMLFSISGYFIKEKDCFLIEMNVDSNIHIINNNICEIFYDFIFNEIYLIRKYYENISLYNFNYSILFAINKLLSICKKLNIDIEKFIIAKMSYNKTREYKHGKY